VCYLQEYSFYTSLMIPCALVFRCSHALSFPIPWFWIWCLWWYPVWIMCSTFALLLCSFAFFNFWFLSCGYDEFMQWWDLDLLIHQVVRIYPAWANFSLFIFHYFFTIYTTVFIISTSFHLKFLFSSKSIVNILFYVNCLITVLIIFVSLHYIFSSSHAYFIF